MRVWLHGKRKGVLAKSTMCGSRVFIGSDFRAHLILFLVCPRLNVSGSSTWCEMLIYGAKDVSRILFLFRKVRLIWCSKVECPLKHKLQGNLWRHPWSSHVGWGSPGRIYKPGGTMSCVIYRPSLLHVGMVYERVAAYSDLTTLQGFIWLLLKYAASDRMPQIIVMLVGRALHASCVVFGSHSHLPRDLQVGSLRRPCAQVIHFIPGHRPPVITPVARERGCAVRFAVFTYSCEGFFINQIDIIYQSWPTHDIPNCQEPTRLPRDTQNTCIKIYM